MPDEEAILTSISRVCETTSQVHHPLKWAYTTLMVAKVTSNVGGSFKGVINE